MAKFIDRAVIPCAYWF